MLKRFYSFFATANLTDEQLKSIREEMAAKNANSLRVYSIVAAIFFAFAAAVAYFTGLTILYDNLYCYEASAFINVVILCITSLAGKKHPVIIDVMQDLFVGVLLAFGLFITLAVTPEQITVFLIAMFVLTPHLFVNKPIHMQVLLLVAIAIFLTVAYRVKPPEIMPLEIMNSIIYCSIGLVTGHYSSRTKLNGLVFERRVTELNDKEQLASYLKSVSNIYVSLHYIDLENGTFVQLKSNHFIDNSLDSPHENFAKQIQLAMTATTKPEYLEGVLKFADMDTFKERIRGKATITHEFMGKNFGWCRARFIAVGDVTKDSVPRYVIYAVESINEQKNREKTLITKAATDAMTGLLNRQAGLEKITTCLNEKKQGMLCLFDIDKFKNVNDTYGHQAGDDVILAVADTMRRAFRENDILMRLGGDEFIVYVSGISTEDLGTQIISRFFAMLDKANIERIPDYSISVSLGAAFYKGEDGMDIDCLYNRADTTAYQSKKIEGRSFTFWRQP